jgi:hypothetical protein
MSQTTSGLSPGAYARYMAQPLDLDTLCVLVEMMEPATLASMATAIDAAVERAEAAYDAAPPGNDQLEESTLHNARSIREVIAQQRQALGES